MSSSLRRSCRVILIILISLGVFVFALSSCVEPSPLYGTWADNGNNRFSLFDDNTFVAKISGVIYEGNYSVQMNVLTLSRNDGVVMVTEWDIRGNILYLNWTTADKEYMSLSLYKISN